MKLYKASSDARDELLIVADYSWQAGHIFIRYARSVGEDWQGLGVREIGKQIKGNARHGLKEMFARKIVGIAIYSQNEGWRIEPPD